MISAASRQIDGGGILNEGVFEILEGLIGWLSINFCWRFREA
jgi:hypothetical protein